ncbi:MAG: bacillithiol transferase BstA [Chloracidobacterium sp.]|nr:bacillithiol transferase BstA [Chloracidobacterium sp.]
MTDDLRFPIGDFDRNYEVSSNARASRIQVINELPAKLAAALSGLDDDQLDTRYRPEGWTVRQTVHHLADSHSNSLTRFKLALTEDTPPTIKTYFEERWAELADSKLPIDVSIAMLSAIHVRWERLLRSMSDNDFQKSFIHPETGNWPLEGALALYAWHSEHHTAHITHLRERNGW